MSRELHDLACHRDSEGELVCSCRPMLLVRESPTSETGKWDNRITANEAGNIRISDGPASVLIPPGRGRSRTRGMRP